MENNKALFIDVINQSVTEVLLPKHFQSISKQIGNGCELFCCPYSFPNGDSIYADDESLTRYQDIKGGFMFPNWAYPIVGNAVILGTDDEGDSIDAITTADEISKMIIWRTEADAKEWANQVFG